MNTDEKELTLFEKVVITIMLVAFGSLVVLAYTNIWDNALSVRNKIGITALLTIVISIFLLKIVQYNPKEKTK